MSMGANSFNKMEIDAIGEIMNISLGASATAVSTLLGAKVNITTPMVEIQTKDEFEFQRMEPAIGVEISYTEGLSGKNIMMFRRDDVRVIVGMLMGQEEPADQFELDEIHLSAICEVMNQMMGSSATALSEFLGTTVNISTPVSFEIKDSADFKDKYFSDPDGMVIVRFQLEIVGKLKSEFMNIMSVQLTKRLLTPFEDTIKKAENDLLKKEEKKAEESSQAAVQAEDLPPQAPHEQMESKNQQTEQKPEPEAVQPAQKEEAVRPEPAPAPAAGLSQKPAAPSGQQADQTPIFQPQPAMEQTGPAPVPVQGGTASMDPVFLQLLNQMQQTQVQMMELMRDMKKEESQNHQPALIRPLNADNIQEAQGNGQEDQANQEMLMSVPLEVSVEIGRTRKLVRDILEFTQGSLVVLDKMAGEQVDLFVNGQCIAKGDIVVVEDNFGIRITEIVSGGWMPEDL